MPKLERGRHSESRRISERFLVRAMLVVVVFEVLDEEKVLEGQNNAL